MPFADAPSAVPVFFLLQVASFPFHSQLFSAFVLQGCLTWEPQSARLRTSELGKLLCWHRCECKGQLLMPFLGALLTVTAWIWPKPLAFLPKPRGGKSFTWKHSEGFCIGRNLVKPDWNWSLPITFPLHYRGCWWCCRMTPKSLSKDSQELLPTATRTTEQLKGKSGNLILLNHFKVRNDPS